MQAQDDGLIEFVRYFWDVLEPNRPLVEGWALQAICSHLEAVTHGQINRLLINVPPGFMKSLLTNVFWPLWEWAAQDKPSNRFVAFSYAAYLTERDNGRFSDLINSPKFQELWGAKLRLREDGKVRVGNDKTGWKFASSVGGVGTGERGDRVILDDPHNVKEAESQAVRGETTRWFREAMQNRLNDLQTGAIIVIMQRVHEDDVSGVILSEYPEYTHLCIPMEYEPERHCATDIGWSDPRIYPGELAWPERFSAPGLRVFQVNKYAWAGQYQQRPEPRGGGILQRDWWQLWDDETAGHEGCRAGTFPPFSFILASLDPAYTEKQENDFSALTIWGVWADRLGNRRIMLVRSWAKRLELNPLVTEVAETLRKVKADKLLIEAKASGHSVAQEMRRLYADEAWAVQLIDPRGGDKVARAYAVQHLFSEGMIYAPDRDWADQVISQCATFPKGKHDDLVDSVTQALSHLRTIGLAQRVEERRIADEDDARHRPQVSPLYEV